MINAIIAIDSQGGIGKDGKLPWLSYGDLEYFKMHTIGHIVVMGRGTWDAPDMPKPLPARTNWVVTSTVSPALAGAHIWHDDPKELVLKLEVENPSKIIWVIGGAKLISSLYGVFNRIYLTTSVRDYNCDTKINLEELIQGYKLIYNFDKFADKAERRIYEKLSPTVNKDIS